MARVLHLISRPGATLAAGAIRHDLDAGDEVTVALLDERTPDPSLPGGVAVVRVGSEWSYDQLLEHIFSADRVVAW
jgi:hypothetical protein